MYLLAQIVVAAMILLHPAEPPENPWKSKITDALRATETALGEALEVAWHADDWQVGQRLGQAAAALAPRRSQLLGPAVRALWRAGQIAQAEQLAAGISLRTDDRVAVRTQVELCLARRELAEAERWVRRLEELKPESAEDLHALLSVRLLQGKMDGLAGLARELESRAKAENGYPDVWIAENVDGLAKYLEAVGTQPVNQVTRYGSAPMSALVMFNLPTCDVVINGKGPFRLVVDTGGSIMLAIDDAVADEAGLRSIAPASIRGVSGTQETQQVLIERLEVGTIRCERVIGRVFGIRAAMMNAADGIIGTGIFGGARMTLDFAGQQIRVDASSEQPGPGQPLELRLVGDAKLIALVQLQSQPATALLDTGADAMALSPARLRALFPDRPIRSVDTPIGIGVGQGADPGVSFGSPVVLTIAGKRLPNSGGLALSTLDTTLSPVIGMQIDALLGMPLFRQTRSVTVDFPRCKMWMDWLPSE